MHRGAGERATAAAATSPATKVTAPITMAFAASTRPRRGLAASVTRIRPRRYSAVMNIGRDHDHRDQPGERAHAGSRATVAAVPRPAVPAGTGAMSPDPVTVNAAAGLAGTRRVA